MVSHLIVLINWNSILFKIETYRFICHPSKSAPTSRRASNFSFHEEDFDDGDRVEEEPSSLAPALSISAISAITGVSCFDDDDENESANFDVGEIGSFKDHRKEKTVTTSLISGLSSSAVNTFSSLVGQRAQSEPPQSVPLINEESHLDVNEIHRRPIRRKRIRKRCPKFKLDYPDYYTEKQNVFTGARIPGSRTFRKVPILKTPSYL